LILVAVAPSTPDDRPARASSAASGAPVVAPVTEFASFSTSRNLPLEVVRERFEAIQRINVLPRRVAAYLPLYDEAERVFGVNWRLIASIHRQETAFSASKTTYHGRNYAGCCAGPMQFNLTNGPISTWERYRGSFRSAIRPEQYPHRTARHPSIYDDFDSIMAAGRLLRDAGGDAALGETAWRAAYDYYGHDLFGITYANTVTARALGWRRDGFCVNCLPDQDIIDRLDRKYGVHERRKLLGTVGDAKRARRAARERRKRRHRRAGLARKRGEEHKAERQRRRRSADRRAAAREERPAAEATPTPAGGKRPSEERPPATPTPRPRPTASPEPTPTPQPSPTPTPTPNLLEDLLGPKPGG
jgi:hypothetical protein